MGRKNKIQVVVENFESDFENLVQEYLDDIDMGKAEEYFSNPLLCEAACNVFDNLEDENEEDEDGEAE